MNCSFWFDDFLHRVQTVPHPHYQLPRIENNTKYPDIKTTKQRWKWKHLLLQSTVSVESTDSTSDQFVDLFGWQDNAVNKTLISTWIRQTNYDCMNGIGKTNKSRTKKNAGRYFFQVIRRRLSIAHRHTNRPRWLEFAGMAGGKNSKEEMMAIPYWTKSHLLTINWTAITNLFVVR